MKKNVICFFIVLNLVSCKKSKPVDRLEIGNRDLHLAHVEEFLTVFPYLENYDWIVYSARGNDNEFEDVHLEIEATVGDTTLVAYMIKSRYNEEEISHVDYSVMRFVKNYVAGDEKYTLCLSPYGELLFHYYSLTLSQDYEDLIFINGKYRYLFNQGMLDIGQRKYYLSHSDSLNSINGHDLPKLPYY